MAHSEPKNGLIFEPKLTSGLNFELKIDLKIDPKMGPFRAQKWAHLGPKIAYFDPKMIPNDPISEPILSPNWLQVSIF